MAGAEPRMLIANLLNRLYAASAPGDFILIPGSGCRTMQKRALLYEHGNVNIEGVRILIWLDNVKEEGSNR
jgi:hypothetical protein